MQNTTRHYSFLDKCLMHFDQMLQTVAGGTNASTLPNPAGDSVEAPLSDKQRRYIAGLMRVNHTGEVCAQALYQGQALTARNDVIRVKLEHAAQEETDHLTWCAQRLNELNSHTSFLNPVWYMGSLAIGVTAGLISDQVNLGFLAETERQVEQHLTDHLQKIPAEDQRSRKILERMRADEAQHAVTAVEAGAAELPAPVKMMMRLMSKVMTKTTFWV